jgi:ubiquinone/menaquinone biosynthesis C-methylase UbiE
VKASANLSDIYRRQRQVDEYFKSETLRWDLIYKSTHLLDRIYQLRSLRVLKMVDALHMPERSRVLEVGCGAGHTTVKLARRGYAVFGVDTLKEMIALTRHSATEGKMAERVFLSIGDVCSLHFPDCTFDLTIAIGVLPWVLSADTAIEELSRVVKPGGHLIMSFNNFWRLDYLLDPLLNPLLKPIRTSAKRVLRKTGAYDVNEGLKMRMHSIDNIKSLVNAHGLELIKVDPIGFGPFSFLGVPILPDSAGLRLHENLQRLADQNFPGIRATGRNHIVLAKKKSLNNTKPYAS